MTWIKPSDRLPQNRQVVIVWYCGEWEKAEFAGGIFYVAGRDGTLDWAVDAIDFWAEVPAPGKE